MTHIRKIRSEGMTTPLLNTDYVQYSYQPSSVDFQIISEELYSSFG